MMRNLSILLASIGGLCLLCVSYVHDVRILDDEKRITVLEQKINGETK